MSSLAFYGSPIDYDNTLTNSINKNNENIINKKRNKTQKNIASREPYYSEKVNTLLSTIHNNLPDEEMDLNNYKPLSPPESIGVQKTIDMENIQQHQYNNSNVIEKNNSNYGEQQLNYNIPQNNIKFPLLSENDNNWGLNDIRNYRKQYNPEEDNNNILINKLNYMIHLLEEKNDEKTNNVLEEVILYSFLGIFIIFLIDSFTHLGKYKR